MFNDKIMCLATKTDTPSIAQKDIVCYKFYILRKVYPPHEDAVLLSPYQDSPAPIINEVTNTLLGGAEYAEVFLNCITISMYLVNLGFHSFKCFNDLVEETHFHSASTIKIFKCIIPKGSKYYEGVYCEYPSYCSESIILKEIIDVK